MGWDIVPFVKFGPIDLGTNRSAVRTLLGGDFRTFRKSRQSVNDTDAYDGVGVHVYYESDDSLREVEAFRPCEPVYKGLSIFELSPQELLSKMASLGEHALPTSACFTFEGVGISIYVAPEGHIGSVGVSSKSYWPTYLSRIREIAEKEKARKEARKGSGPLKNPFG
jgi:hypothetical protein